MSIFAPTIAADMVKLVDMPDLGSGAARRVGSSPIIRTEKKLLRNQKFFCFSKYLPSKSDQVQKYLSITK
jgi:hypothetical protein